MSFEFSLILSTVDLSKHLIMAWNIRKFIQLVIFVTFSVFYYFFGNRVWLNLNEWALSGNKTSIITGSFYLWKRSCENLFNVEPLDVFHTESVMLRPRFIPGSVFYTQSVMYGTPGLSYVNLLYYMQCSSIICSAFFITCGTSLIICAIYYVIYCAFVVICCTFVVICCGFANIWSTYVIICSNFSIIPTFCHAISSVLSLYRVVKALYGVQTILPRAHFALFAVLSSLYRNFLMICPQCKARVSDPSSSQLDAAILVCFRGKVES